MSAARATSRRGQATTELALLSIVFVTVLVFGVHFAELGALKLRVQQAGIFATWSATGDRAHKLNRPDPLQSPLFYDANDLKDGRNRSPAQATLERYADFDGASGAAGTQVTWSVTRGTSLSARCQPAAVAVPPVLTTPLQRLAPGYRYAQDGNREVDAVACNAHGHIALFGVPAEVLEGQDGFFKRKNIWRPSVEVCAFGRARSGSCRPGPPVAIDDWGLAGDEGGESLQCGFACTIEQAPDSNIAYKQTVQRLYEEYAKSRSLTRNWAIASFVKELFTRNPDDPTLMWFVPVDERDFRFAFTGEDVASQPFHIVTSEIDGTSAGYGPNARVEHRWATTPYSSKYRAGYDDRGQCFAGLPCARSPFDKQHW